MQNYTLWVFNAEQQFLKCFSFIQSKHAPKKAYNTIFINNDKALMT